MPTHPLARIALTPETCRVIAELVERFRPDWPAHVTASILSSHPNAAAHPVAIAALRAAGDPDLPHPRSIMWKGKHWSGLEGDLPDSVTPQQRCTVCGKIESQCYTAPGRHLDDHPFTPPE